ncbi:MAG: PilZ domain-containing protein [Phycisphaerales bacterium JB052]
MPSQPRVNRRIHERFLLQPGYTAASVRLHPKEREFTREGHVYDISEGGIRFELDHPIELGSTISMRIQLPSNCQEAGPDHCVYVTGNVIWCDLDEPGPSKMAMAITRFDRQGDKARMLRSLTSKRYLRAA